MAERWIGSCRRELLEHVVVFGERYLVRLIRSYLEYYHGDRSHLGLGKDAPNRRAVTQRPSATAKVVALPPDVMSVPLSDDRMNNDDLQGKGKS